MTTTLNIQDMAARLTREFGEGITPSAEYVEVAPALLARVAAYLKNTPELDFDYLDMATAADYADRFELIYRLLSLKNNTALSLKVRSDRSRPVVPSLAKLWHGAYLQEREIYDLFGIEFDGHPDLRRIVLWEGYEGHPLRKDFKDKVYGAGD